jgi:GNAT superfamily N-acetyltransferase
MERVLQNCDDIAAVIRQMECNLAEFLLTMGRAGGGEEVQTPRLAWTIGGSPIDYHNAVVRADLSEPEAEAVSTEVASKLRARGVPGVWHLGPSMKPANLREILLRGGWMHAGDEPGMAVDLRSLRPDEVPDGVAIREVASAEDLEVWTGTLGQGFGEGPAEAAWAGEVFGRIGLGAESSWRHYLGLLDGRPVATASVLTACGVAGLYFVMTVPEERRRGIGSAITVRALLSARDQGYEVGVLQASEQGKGIYEALGFQELCQFELWAMDLS